MIIRLWVYISLKTYRVLNVNNHLNQIVDVAV